MRDELLEQHETDQEARVRRILESIRTHEVGGVTQVDHVSDLTIQEVADTLSLSVEDLVNHIIQEAQRRAVEGQVTAQHGATEGTLYIPTRDQFWGLLVEQNRPELYESLRLSIAEARAGSEVL